MFSFFFIFMSWCVSLVCMNAVTSVVPSELLETSLSSLSDCLTPLDFVWIYLAPWVMWIPSWCWRYPCYPSLQWLVCVCVCVYGREKFCRFLIHDAKRAVVCFVCLHFMVERWMPIHHTRTHSSILCGFRNILFHIWNKLRDGVKSDTITIA